MILTFRNQEENSPKVIILDLEINEIRTIFNNSVDITKIYKVHQDAFETLSNVTYRLNPNGNLIKETKYTDGLLIQIDKE